MASAQRLAVIITALPVEQKAVVAHLRNVTEEPPVDGSIYRRGVFDERSVPWDVVVAEIGPGNVGAAAEAVRVITHYSPQVAFFVGVAGAIKDLKHGDVVAATKVYGYDSGKDENDDFKTRPAVYLTTYRLEQRARYEAGEEAWRRRIKGTSTHGVVPDARVAPIAAGEKVVASNRSLTYKFLRQHYGDAVAVEMEGHGFLLGVHMSEPTQGIVVRGISDLVDDKDKENDDKWQPIAASHAAAFAFQVLAKLTPEESDPARYAEATQQVIIGDVSGDNNTLTIHQHQGLTPEDLARLQTAAPDANAEIDAACARITAGEPDIAIHLLKEIQKKCWDRLLTREKYRVVANIGNALERKGEFGKAAQYFMDAKQHQPHDENARTLEAIAFYHLGQKTKAYELAGDIIKDHPNCSLAITVRIRSAPAGISFDSLEQAVPTALREEMGILHALGWRALTSGDVSAAERLCRTALKHHPDSIELKEQLATIVVHVEGRAKRANQPVNGARLEEAVAAMTARIAQNRGQKDGSRLRYTRAEAYDLLGKTEDAETDFRAATEVDKDEPDVIRRFALFLERHDRIDAAIEALRQADKIHPDWTNRLMLAGLLGERKRPGDWESAVALLRESIPLTTEPETRAGMVATLTQLLGSLKRHEEAIAYLDGLSEGFLTVLVAATIRSGVLLSGGAKR